MEIPSSCSSRQDNEAECCIEDNGNGISGASGPESAGIQPVLIGN
jgi:hypothetical protein